MPIKIFSKESGIVSFNDATWEELVDFHRNSGISMNQSTYDNFLSHVFDKAPTNEDALKYYVGRINGVAESQDKFRSLTNLEAIATVGHGKQKERAIFLLSHMKQSQLGRIHRGGAYKDGDIEKINAIWEKFGSKGKE